MFDRTDQLRQLMQAKGIASFRILSETAQLSRRAVDTIRKGRAETLKYQDLDRLSQILQIPLPEFMQTFCSVPVAESVNETAAELAAKQSANLADSDIEALKAEYHRLQQQMQTQRQTLRTEFEQETLQHIESWLLQWPTAAHAAQQNPTVPARNLLPLLRPLEDLLKKWGLTAIAQVGEIVAYDPQVHQLIEGDGVAVGDRVVVRYVGYRQGEKLLYRARVSFSEDEPKLL